MSERGLAAVTGASGRLGAAVVRALREDGWRVRALVHRRDAPGADETVRGDVLDPAALERLLGGAHALLHAAAVTHARSSRAYERVNVEGTRLVLAAAEAARVRRVVHVSTSALDPRGGAYSRSKLAAEELARRAAVPVTIVRLPELWGDGDGAEGLDALVASARRGRPLLVVGRGDQELRPVHVEDAARALAAALASPAADGRTYTLAAARTTFAAVAERLRAASGGRSRIVHVPEPLVRAAAAAARVLPLPLYPDQPARLRAERPPPTPEAEADLGFRPRPFPGAPERG
ncbi:MAG TPA: NAD-dependent epimerase/dehydratase family protein [Gaiellaceae bacterium]|nr:NAD-dependent epimerase/dehydratase family protein [Gaiellaceae bacterium]